MNWVIAKMDHLGKCAVGQKLNSECHKTTYTGKVGFLHFSQLDKEKNHLYKFISQKQLLNCKTHKNVHERLDKLCKIRSSLTMHLLFPQYL